jgi:hypothetical protein
MTYAAYASCQMKVLPIELCIVGDGHPHTKLPNVYQHMTYSLALYMCNFVNVEDKTAFTC